MNSTPTGTRVTESATRQHAFSSLCSVIRHPASVIFLFAFCLLPSAFCLSVSSPTPAPSAGADIRGIVAPQPVYLAGSYWLLLLAAVSVLAAVAVGWVLYRSLRRPTPVHIPSPHEVAYARLNELRARADSLEPRMFGVDVTDILRDFIGSQYGLTPRRQTSQEFLDAIRGATVFSASQHTILSDFLTHCDLLKFAREDAGREVKSALLEQAATFLGADTRPAPLPSPAELPSLPSTPPPLPSSERYPYESPESRYMPPGERPPAPSADEPAAPVAAP